MIINVIPYRLSRAAEELRRAEKTLTYDGYRIEETIESLKHSDDEALLLIAEKLSKTLDRLQIRIRMTKAIITALDRIAAVYAKTEDRVISYEDEVITTWQVTYSVQDISKVIPQAARTFEIF